MKLTELMVRKRMTAYHLANAVEPFGVSQQAIYRLVRARGRVKRIDLNTLAALCAVFGVTPNALLTTDDKEPPAPPAGTRGIARTDRSPVRGKRAA